MEYLLVTYPEERDVTIDSVVAGLTNQIITLEAGTYTVSLAPPRNFAPRSQTVTVEDTAPLEPLEVVFA
jgi:hypothetical protein